MATATEPTERDELAGLRKAGLIASLVGAVGSLAFLFNASGRRQPILLAIFVLWVLSPFHLLVLADAVARRRHWAALTRATIYRLMFVVALVSLAAYGYDLMHPRKAQPAAFYVMVAPLCWALSVVVLTIAAAMSRGRPDE